MPRIKIEDLPVLQDLSAQEKKGLFGGLLLPIVQTVPESADSDSDTSTEELVRRDEEIKSTY